MIVHILTSLDYSRFLQIASFIILAQLLHVMSCQTSLRKAFALLAVCCINFTKLLIRVTCVNYVSFRCRYSFNFSLHYFLSSLPNCCMSCLVKQVCKRPLHLGLLHQLNQFVNQSHCVLILCWFCTKFVKVFSADMLILCIFCQDIDCVSILCYLCHHDNLSFKIKAGVSSDKISLSQEKIYLTFFLAISSLLASTPSPSSSSSSSPSPCTAIIITIIRIPLIQVGHGIVRLVQHQTSLAVVTGGLLRGGRNHYICLLVNTSFWF